MNKVEILSSNALRRPVCIGTGLVALDIVISSDHKKPAKFFAGGSCGNVMAILSYLGWESYPIARLSNNVAAEMLLQDLSRWNVKEDLISVSRDGSTPIIIHRILRDKQGAPKHRFEFRNPEDGSYLPSYKPCLAKSVNGLLDKKPNSNVFYFDRINRGAINLAKAHKENGAVIFFEPSSIRDLKGFQECLVIADVVKFSHDRISEYEEFYKIGQVPLEIQTLGKQGLKYRCKDESKWCSMDSFLIDDVIDSAGAGDWTTAGIIKSLFENNNSVVKLNENQIIKGLRFGQILGALNCTFEAARGMMYSIPSNELLIYVDYILSSSIKKLNQQRKQDAVDAVESKDLNISSLFVEI